MPMSLSILYRGPLSSCNYDCGYCPFAKRKETTAELTADRRALARFVDWVATREHPVSVFFTPWGEALVRSWYRAAVARLSLLPHVGKVAVQTNLACSLGWLEACNAERLGLWCTYHPGQVSRARFVRQCRRLERAGVSFSVGVVGLKEHFGEIEALRGELPPATYLWINAFKREPDYYQPADLQRLEAVDPLFRLNTMYHASLGRACRCGDSVIAVDGEGTIRRCHFLPQPIGNIYQPGFETALRPRPCSRPDCGCHIGYVHLDDLQLYDVFGSGVLERVPTAPAHQASSAAPKRA